MTEIEQNASKLFSKMLDSCNISYSIEKKNDYNGDNRYYISLKSKTGDYSCVWFSKDNDDIFKSSKFDCLYVKFDVGDDIEALPKIILDYLMFYGYNRIMATDRKRGDDICIFNIPTFKSISELHIKLDLQIGMGE